MSNKLNTTIMTKLLYGGRFTKMMSSNIVNRDTMCTFNSVILQSHIKICKRHLRTSKNNKVQTNLTSTISDVHRNNHHDDDDTNTLTWSKFKSVPWRKLFRETWTEYKLTWEGFFDNHRDSKPENDDKNNAILQTAANLQSKRDEISKNAQQNVQQLKDSTFEAIDIIKDKTGIYNQRDLKVFAMNQMKLASECITEFMRGYRKGRDDEFYKTMNEYFKDLDDMNLSSDTVKKEKKSVDISQEELKKDTVSSDDVVSVSSEVKKTDDNDDGHDREEIAVTRKVRIRPRRKRFQTTQSTEL